MSVKIFKYNPFRGLGIEDLEDHVVHWCMFMDVYVLGISFTVSDKFMVGREYDFEEMESGS